MVTIKIREVAEKRGITNAYQLQKALSTLPGTAARLWRSEMKMISLDTIDNLCAAFDCEPGDLFQRKSPSSKAKK